MKTLLAALALLACALPVAAESDSQPAPADTVHAANPAYVDVAALGASYGEPRVMINLNGSLLRLASAIHHGDPAAAAALESLESVHINVYDTGGDTEPAAERMRAVGESLLARQWSNIVRVREDDELVDIYLKQAGDHIQGITVMAVDAEETVFINILGDIDTDQLQTIVESMDMDMDIDFSLADM